MNGMIDGMNESIFNTAVQHTYALIKSWEEMPCGGEIVLRLKVDDDGCLHRKVNLNNQSIDCTVHVVAEGRR